LKVRCPKCGYEQTTTTIHRVKCWNCGATYRVYYRTRYGREWVWRSRVVKIVEGTEEELLKAFENLKMEKLMKKREGGAKDVNKLFQTL